CRQDLPVLTKPALGDLFIDPSLLERVQPAVRSKPFQGRNFALYRGHRHDAGTNRRAIDEHGTGAALAKSAAKLGSLQPQIIAENIEQRRPGLHIRRVRTAVDFQRDLTHPSTLQMTSQPQTEVCSQEDADGNILS